MTMHVCWNVCMDICICWQIYIYAHMTCNDYTWNVYTYFKICYYYSYINIQNNLLRKSLIECLRVFRGWNFLAKIFVKKIQPHETWKQCLRWKFSMIFSYLDNSINFMFKITSMASNQYLQWRLSTLIDLCTVLQL